MKNYLIAFIFFFTCNFGLKAQTWINRTIANHNHGLALNNNVALSGSTISFRPGLGFGYTFFADKYNIKSIIEYGRWSVGKGDFVLGETRSAFKFEFEKYLSKIFSLGFYSSTEFRYNEDFYPNNDPRNRSEVSYVYGLGISPKIYHNSERYYFSLGIDLPIVEGGYFQGDGPDPVLDDWETFEQGLDIHFLEKEIRAVFTVGYRI